MFKPIEYTRLAEVGLTLLRLHEDANGWTIQHLVDGEQIHSGGQQVLWMDLYHRQDYSNTRQYLHNLLHTQEDAVEDGLPTVRDRTRALALGLTLLRITLNPAGKFQVDFCRPSNKVWTTLVPTVPDLDSLVAKLDMLRVSPRTIVLPQLPQSNKPLIIPSGL